MKESINILRLAISQPTLSQELDEFVDEDLALSDHTGLRVQRYACHPSLVSEDMALAVYHPISKEGGPSLQLTFCLAGNRYCTDTRCKSGFCEKARPGSGPKSKSLDVFQVTFREKFFLSFPAGKPGAVNLMFSPVPGAPHVKTLSVCGRSRLLLEQILHHSHEDLLQQIFLQAKCMELLICSNDCVTQDREDLFSCRFLANPEGREKIVRARDILVQNLDEALTIRELARKVAINECYLKKGFKEIFGTTIYDYFQKERMEKARYLLCEKGLSVTEVAGTMGYSCISHFSTAFRKHTGLKPCELLLR